uniref:Uncharacterized protein n=1 Tax=Bionectria ochroleuca TaxID=29856 RepID=A0A8H7TTY8_BIOOC
MVNLTSTAPIGQTITQSTPKGLQDWVNDVDNLLLYGHKEMLKQFYPMTYPITSEGIFSPDRRRLSQQGGTPLPNKLRASPSLQGQEVLLRPRPDKLSGP